MASVRRTLYRYIEVKSWRDDRMGARMALTFVYYYTGPERDEAGNIGRY
jgi:hypothetical protein